MPSALMLAVGVFLLIAWWIFRSKRHSTQSQQQFMQVEASNGGVAIGGNNSGDINTGQVGGADPKPAGTPLWERLLAIVGSLTGIVGLYLVFFPPGVAGK